MKRILGPAALLALVLAGCGGIAGDTCTPESARVTPTGAGCTLAANTPVTINVRLCPQCTDTSPSCAGEVLPGGEIQLDPLVQKCQANQGCDITQACQIAPVGCALDKPLSPGSYTAQYIGPTGTLERATVQVAQSGGPTSCAL